MMLGLSLLGFVLWEMALLLRLLGCFLEASLQWNPLLVHENSTTQCIPIFCIFHLVKQKKRTQNKKNSKIKIQEKIEKSGTSQSQNSFADRRRDLWNIEPFCEPLQNWLELKEFLVILWTLCKPQSALDTLQAPKFPQILSSLIFTVRNKIDIKNGACL